MKVGDLVRIKDGAAFDEPMYLDGVAVYLGQVDWVIEGNAETNCNRSFMVYYNGRKQTFDEPYWEVEVIESK
jgi:hypothetical protein